MVMLMLFLYALKLSKLGKYKLGSIFNKIRTQKIIIAGVIVGISAVAAWWYVQSPDGKIHNYPSQGQNIIAFGDSLTEGPGVSERDNYVSALSRELGVPIFNAGVSGDTTRDALGRIERGVLQSDPKIVIVLLGGNDYLRRIAREETFANLGEIIDRIHAQGSMVLLLGIRGGFLRDPYQKEFAKLAQEKQTAYIPNILDGILGNSDLMANTIHPNEKGYAVMARRVAPALKALLD